MQSGDVAEKCQFLAGVLGLYKMWSKRKRANRHVSLRTTLVLHKVSCTIGCHDGQSDSSRRAGRRDARNTLLVLLPLPRTISGRWSSAAQIIATLLDRQGVSGMCLHGSRLEATYSPLRDEQEIPPSVSLQQFSAELKEALAADPDECKITLDYLGNMVGFHASALHGQVKSDRV